MANAPSPGDIESLARQYWDAWGGLSGTGQTASPWAAMGVPPAGLGEPAALDWYARMQQLAAQFANGGSSADIGTAWRNLLGGTGGNPFASVLPGAAGLGAMGGAWPEQVRPFVEALLRPMRQQATDWLGQPGLGPGREHQQRLQALGRAWQEWEEHHEAYASLLSSIGQDAFARFERLLVQHESPDKRLTTARALFDLWIDAAEEAWAEAALSEDYQQRAAAMTNALMRVRLRLQDEVERMGGLLGLPGRTELDAVHRKVAALERSVHALRRAAGLPGTGTAPAGAAGKEKGRRKAPPPAPPCGPDAAAAGSTAVEGRKAPAAPAVTATPRAGKPAKAAAGEAPREQAPAKARSGAATDVRKAPGGPRKAAAPSAQAKAPGRGRAAKPPAAAGSGSATAPAPGTRAAGKRTSRPADAGPAARRGAKDDAGQVVSMREWVSRNTPGTGERGRGRRSR